MGVSGCFHSGLVLYVLKRSVSVFACENFSVSLRACESKSELEGGNGREGLRV